MTLEVTARFLRLLHPACLNDCPSHRNFLPTIWTWGKLCAQEAASYHLPASSRENMLCENDDHNIMHNTHFDNEQRKFHRADDVTASSNQFGNHIAYSFCDILLGHCIRFTCFCMTNINLPAKASMIRKDLKQEWLPFTASFPWHAATNISNHDQHPCATKSKRNDVGFKLMKLLVDRMLIFKFLPCHRSQIRWDGRTKHVNFLKYIDVTLA